jgi:SAM-dependent methyltransferase
VSAAALSIAIEPIEQICAERSVIERLLALDGKRILELGCGRADLTRLLAQGGPGRRITALEVDEIQHAKNLQVRDLPNVRFELGGAQAIPAADASFDVVFMFKSLHHVPVASMADGLREIARVLAPGGHAYLSEPIFAGEFNEILRLFHDEQRVRQAAFDAIAAAVEGGLLESVEQVFFKAPVLFPDFAAFERQVIGVTHTRHVLSPALLDEVRQRFMAHAGPDGVRFAQPMRVNLLRRPAVA